MRQLFALSLAIWILALPVVAQVLSPDQVRRTAWVGVQTGDFSIADQAATALLAVDPTDAEALLIRAVTARALGKWEAARRSARLAYRSADVRKFRFDAATIASHVAIQQKRYTAAQVWLRRADQLAPKSAKPHIARAFRHVSDRNPFSFRLKFGLTPSDNVNNGAETTTIFIGGLPFSIADNAQKLGGYEATIGLSSSYRILESKVHRTELTAELFGKKVWLNSKAKRLAPEARGAEFDYGAIVLGVRDTRLIWPELGATQLSAFLGQNWIGGHRHTLWTELRASQIVRLSKQQLFRFGATVRNESRYEDSFSDSLRVGATGEWVRFKNGRRTSIGIGISNFDSDSATIDSMSYRIFGSHSFGTVGKFLPSISVSFETSDYQKWVLFDGRRDETLTGRLDVVLPEASIYGFVPQASLEGRKVWSSVDIYDRSEISMSATLVSRF